MEIFYKYISKKLNCGCRHKRRIGGIWYEKFKAWDGDKVICLDDVVHPCIVYSFGLSLDWSFEELMASTGCQVFGYDPTVEDKNILNVHFEKIGVSHKNSSDMLTLKSILRKNNHTNTTITYLKVDIEMDEINVLPAWINDESLENVQQLGIEFHTGPMYVRLFMRMVVKLLYLGFIPISFDNNEAMGKYEYYNNYYPMFEIVFRRI